MGILTEQGGMNYTSWSILENAVHWLVKDSGKTETGERDSGAFQCFLCSYPNGSDAPYVYVKYML